MPSAKRAKDQFDQFLSFGVTMSAANTLTFGQISVGVSVFEYAAFIIDRIEYWLSQASLNELTNDADFVTVAITGSNTITDIYSTRQEVYDRMSLGVSNLSDVAFQIRELPIVHSFGNMKGGGLIVPAQDIYIGMQTAGFVAAGVAQARVYYTILELQAADYYEIAQRLRVLST